MARNTHRKLAAILAADVVGYTRLMGEDEAGTLDSLRKHREELIEPKIAAHQGRIVKLTGDGVLADFASVVDAVECAAEIQVAMSERNSQVPTSRQIRFRIGVNLGDVIVEGEDIYGDDVNVAVRLQELADPGGINVSRSAYLTARKKLALRLEDIGMHAAKNISEPIHVYRVHAAEKLSAGSEEQFEPPSDELVATHNGSSHSAYMRPAIVVLPFANISDDRSHEYFCDGLTEDITTDLSKFANLVVIAANSAFAYKGSRASPQQLAEDLGVRYVVEGAIQRSKDRVRINVQLIDAEPGHHIWAERFERSVEDLFEVQDEVIQKIVASLAPKVNTSEQHRIMLKPKINMTAYDYYLEGVHQFSWASREALQQSREKFRKATQIDPRFARAWGYLAYCEVRSVLCGWQSAEAIAQAEEYARHAIELGPADYANHWDLAFVLLNEGHFDRALAEYDRAYQLNPNDADLLAEIAEMRIYVGQPQEAVRLIRRAMTLNPHFPDWYLWNLGWAFYHEKRYDDALREFARMSEPQNDIWLFVAAAHAQLGNREEAEVALKTFLQNRNAPYTIADAKKRGNFRRKEDEEHWIDGLRKAGLQD